MLSFSEVTTLELFSAEELFEVAPHIVTNIDVVMALVSLQLKTLYVPALDPLRHLSIRIVNVVASDASKEFSLLLPIFPLSELPILSVDEDSHDALPARLREVRHAIINIKSDRPIGNLPCNL